MTGINLLFYNNFFHKSLTRVTFLFRFQATIAEFRHNRHLNGIVDDRRGRHGAEHWYVPGGRRDVIGRDDGDAGNDGVGDRAVGHLRRRLRKRRHR